MWERLRRFSTLEPAARGLFLRAAVLLPMFSLSLGLREFRATQAAIQRLASPSKEILRSTVMTNDVTLAEKVELTARMVRAAVRYGGGKSTCLETSLVLWWLLARQGAASRVRIVARKASGKSEAHDWLECQGVTLKEPEELHRHYAAFDAEFSSLPPDVQ